MDAEDPAAARDEKADLARWWRKLGVRAFLYGLALFGLAVVAGWRIFPLTILAAMAVAVAGIVFHHASGRRDDPRLGGPPGLKLAVLVASIEIGVLICVWQQWRIFGRVGFLGLSLIAFGIGQLMAEIRGMHSARAAIVGLLWLNCIAALIPSLALGVGGMPLLVIAVVLALPAVALSSEYLIHWLTELNWEPVGPQGEPEGATTKAPLDMARVRTKARRVVSGDRGARTEILRSPALMIVIALVGLALSAWGVVLLSGLGGWRLAVIIAVVAFALIVMVSSNTDADVLVVVFAVALVWTQIPGGTERVPPFRADATESIVVLGDSYISGEGARSYVEGTNTREPDQRNECRQSTKAWARLVFGDRPGVGLDFLACSGAKVTNVSARGEGQYIGENSPKAYIVRDDDPQHVLSQLERWDLLRDQRAGRGISVGWAFVSIGGNDAGFGDIVAECLGPGDCSQAGQHRLDALRTTLEPRLDTLYDELEQRFPSRMVVVPYPVGIVDDEGRPDCSIFRSTFTSRERRFLAGFTRQLDATIRFKAAEHGLRYVPEMVEAFTDRRICETDRANANVNYLALSPVGGDTDPSGWLHNSMHPNEHGHAVMAGVIESWLRDPLAPEEPQRVGRPSLSLTEVMGDGHEYCMDAARGRDCVPAPVTSSFDELRHAVLDHLPGVLLVVLGGWLAALAGLSRRHVVRGPMATEFTPWLSASLDRVRTRSGRLVVGLAVVAVSAGTFFVLLNFMVALDDGYIWSQSKSAADLRALDAFQLRTYYAAASRDMVWYIPAYVMCAIVVVLLTAQRNYQPAPTDRPQAAAENDRHARRYQSWRCLPRTAWFALGAIVVTATADLAETWLFKQSLSTLITRADAGLGARPAWTLGFTVVKGLAAATLLVLVMFGIVCRRPRNPRPPRETSTLDEHVPPPELIEESVMV